MSAGPDRRVGGGLIARWRDAARLLADHRDVLDERPAAGDAPRTLLERGWAPYLLALDNAALDDLEGRGVDADWPAGAPDSLVAFASSVRSVSAVPALRTVAQSLERPKQRLETPRKRAQIEAFARAILPLTANATRVVDVGSGHGHLTRELADRLGVPVVGLERDAALAGRARALSSRGTASFAVMDVLREGLSLTAGDCVVGLHACGELGDAMVESAARAGAALALVGCCLQKRRSSSRRPLCSEDEDSRLDLPTALLGLSNLTARDEGVEASRAENLMARERRLALHRLLAEAGFELRLGAEIEGLNRRAAHGELDVLVGRAFELRRRAPPSPAAVASAARWAAIQHARTRRLTLPRSLLARVLEVFVLLDRARHLETHGLEVTIGALFPASVSARNLALFGARRGA
jgi:SAM-dependent methyltransferase